MKYKSRMSLTLLGILSPLLLTGVTIQTDPTRPPDSLLTPSKNLSSLGPLKLSAVFVHPNSRYAIISGQLVKLGDKVDSYTIIKITNDTVELKGTQDQPVVLPLLPTVKQASIVK